MAIWLVTPKFIHNHMCINAANFSLLHYGIARNMSIQFSDNPVNFMDANKSLVSFLDSRMGISRAKVSKNDPNDRYFKEKLQRFLLDPEDDENVEDTSLLLLNSGNSGDDINTLATFAY